MALEVNQRLLFVGLGGTGINATIELESMMVRSNGKTEIEFIQSYHSLNYSDRVRKRLTLIRQHRSFLIEIELTLKVLPLI